MMDSCIVYNFIYTIQDFASKPEDVAVTLNGFSHIVTPDLARDLGSDVIKMLTHSRAQIRKRAVLALYKVLTKYPELTQPAMTRLRERLEDPDPSTSLVYRYSFSFNTIHRCCLCGC